MVVGAGIAGMEAEWLATARGHDVTVFGSGAEVGGKARLRARLPGGDTITSIYDYQHTAALRAGARIELGVAANAGDILALNPHAVVLATGATAIAPDWIPPQMQAEGLVPDLHRAMDDVLRHPGRQGILRRLAHKPIDIVTLSEPLWSDAIVDARLEYANVYSGRIGVTEDIAFLAYATPKAPNDALAGPLPPLPCPPRPAGTHADRRALRSRHLSALDALTSSGCPGANGKRAPAHSRRRRPPCPAQHVLQPVRSPMFFGTPTLLNR